MRDTVRMSDERGTGLVEALVATVLTAVGVLSVAALMGLGAKMQGSARMGSTAWAVATAEIERLRTLAPTDPQRMDGGSLTADVTPGAAGSEHFANRGLLHVRWRVENKGTACAPVGGIAGAPVECAKNLMVIAITPNGQALQARIDTVLFR